MKFFIKTLVGAMPFFWVSCDAPLPKCSQQVKPISLELNKQLSFSLAGENYDEVFSVLDDHCLECHSTDVASGGVILDTKEEFDKKSTLAETKSGDGHQSTSVPTDQQEIIKNYVISLNSVEEPKLEGFAKVKVVLDASCNTCHSTEAASGGAILDTEDGFKAKANEVKDYIADGHKSTAVSDEDQKVVTDYITSLDLGDESGSSTEVPEDPAEEAVGGEPASEEPTAENDGSAEGQQSQDAVATQSAGVCEAPKSGGKTGPGTGDARPGKGLDPLVRETLYPEAFKTCLDQSLVYDRRTEKCHEAKLATRFECTWEGVEYRFKNVQGAADELGILQDEGWQIDQCGEMESGTPVIFIVRVAKSGDEVDVDVKVISTQPIAKEE